MTPEEELKDSLDYNAADVASEAMAGRDALNGPKAVEVASPEMPRPASAIARGLLTDSSAADAPPPPTIVYKYQSGPDAPNARYESALADVQRIASEPAPGPDVAGLQAAQSADDERRRRNDLTRAISAWMLKTPYAPSEPTGEKNALAVEQMKQQAAGQSQTRRLSAAEAIAKALKGEPSPGALSEYQKFEIKNAGEKNAAEKAKLAGALDNRKQLMLSLYPEHKQEIESLTDLGSAQTLQTALEGRAGRVDTQAHADKAAADSADRSFKNAIALKEWEKSHQDLTAEQKAQLEGINKSGLAIDTFEKGMGSTSTILGSVAASFPKIGGMLGATGADFPSLKKGTAIALARGMEGGTARPGNVEIINQMLPDASDSEATKKQKIANTREFVANNQEAFMRTAQQGGARPMGATAPHQKPQTTPARPKGIPENAVEKNGKWYQPYPDGSGWDEIETH